MESTVFSRLNAGGVYLKLGLVVDRRAGVYSNPAFIRTRRLFEPGVYSGPSVYLLSAFSTIFQPLIFFISGTGGLLN